MKEKFRYLFKNFSFLLIGSFSSKILNFLLVPLYTAVLTTEEYGSYDIIYDTILLLIPIMSLNITDAIMRFTVEADASTKKDVIAVTNKYTFRACLCFFAGLTIFHLLSHNELTQRFFPQIVILFICVIVQQNLVQIAKGLERIKDISVSGVIGTLVAVGANFYFLVIRKYGLPGYFAATILSMISQIVFLTLRTKLLVKMSFSVQNRRLEKEMLSFSIPLIATTLSWHVNSIADRYTVILFEGLAANGIYAVSYKIPAIMTAVQTIFIQSWQLSAVKEFQTDEGKAFVNRTYTVVQTVMVILCSCTIICTRFLAKILFKADFFDAWICVPTLVFYVLFNTLSGTLGGIFSAVKDTKAFMNTAIIGALTNILLNFVLIWWWGILGAAIATAISSVVIWGLRLRSAQKYIKIEYRKNRGIMQLLLLVIQAVIMTTIVSYYGYIIQAVILACLLYCNKEELHKWWTGIKRGHLTG